MNPRFVAAVLIGLHLFSSEPVLQASKPSSVDGHDNVADFLVGKSEIWRGICSIPFAKDAELSISLAGNSELLIHTVVPTQADLASIQNDLIKYKLLGRRVYVDQGHRSRVAFTDNYVDLLIVEEAGALESNGGSVAELFRAIRPSGVALFRCGTGAAAAASLQTFKQWLGSFPGVVTNLKHGDEQWTLIRKPEPQGLADWPYWYGNAGNNP